MGKTPYEKLLKEEITATENIFKRLLINRLNEEGIRCNIFHNHFLPCFKERKKNNAFDRKYGFNLESLIIVRPDFYIPEAGLIVEIDGDIHNRGFKARIDRKNEEILEGHGLVVLRIPNKVLYSFKKGYTAELFRYIAIIVNAVIESSLCEKRQRKIRKSKKSVIAARHRLLEELEYEIDIQTSKKKQDLYKALLKAYTQPKDHKYPDLDVAFSCKKYGGYKYVTGR